MADERLKAWLRQARADLGAARGEAGEECHRRYWLQQACEKGIKALGLVIWNGPAAHDGVFRGRFLHRHSPLKQLAEELDHDPALPKSLRLLLRQIESELARLDGEGGWGREEFQGLARAARAGASMPKSGSILPSCATSASTHGDAERSSPPVHGAVSRGCAR